MSVSPGPDFSRVPREVGPEPAPTEAEPRRIPHFGHAALFVMLAIVLVFGTMLVLLTVAGHGAPGVHPKVQIASLASADGLSILIAWVIFPRIWNRSFLEGIRWNLYAVRLYAPRLVALGLMLGLVMQLVTYFVAPPKTLPIEQFFASPLDGWLMTIFGVMIAPIFEEICFRGFLVPAFAIAYDFLSRPRTPEAEVHWRTTTTLSPVSLLFSAVLTSLMFAWLHAAQVAYLWPALVALFSVSLLLTIVRIRTQSVAASALVHAAYNSFIFLLVILQTGGYRHLDRLTK